MSDEKSLKEGELLHIHTSVTGSDGDDRDFLSDTSQWTKEDKKKLLNAVGKMRGSSNTKSYKIVETSLKWGKIKVDGKSAEECKAMFRKLIRRVRKDRTMQEIIADAIVFIDEQEKQPRKEAYREQYRKLMKKQEEELKIFKQKYPDCPLPQVKSIARPKPPLPSRLYVESRIGKTKSKHPELVKHPGVPKKHPGVPKKHPDMPKKHPDMPKKHPDMPKKHPDMPKKHPDMPKKHPDMPKKHPDMPKKHPGVPKKHPDMPKKHPDMPKKPPASFGLFVMDMTKKFPEIKSTEKMQVFAKDWKKLPEKEKEPYREQYWRLMKKYEEELKIFKQKYPDCPLPPVKSTARPKPPLPSKLYVVSPIEETKSKHPELVRHPSMPKKPPGYYSLFVTDMAKKFPEIKANERMQVFAKAWSKLPEKKKEAYREKYRRLMKKYEEELKIFKQGHPDFPLPRVKSIARPKPSLPSRLFVESRIGKTKGKDPAKILQKHQTKHLAKHRTDGLHDAKNNKAKMSDPPQPNAHSDDIYDPPRPIDDSDGDIYDPLQPNANSDDIYDPPRPTDDSDGDIYDPPQPNANSDDDIYDPPQPNANSDDDIYDPPQPNANYDDDIYDPPQPNANYDDDIYDPPQPDANSDDDIYDQPQPNANSDDDIYDPQPSSRTVAPAKRKSELQLDREVTQKKSKHDTISRNPIVPAQNNKLDKDANLSMSTPGKSNAQARTVRLRVFSPGPSTPSSGSLPKKLARELESATITPGSRLDSRTKHRNQHGRMDKSARSKTSDAMMAGYKA